MIADPATLAVLHAVVVVGALLALAVIGLACAVFALFMRLGSLPRPSQHVHVIKQYFEAGEMVSVEEDDEEDDGSDSWTPRRE